MPAAAVACLPAVTADPVPASSSARSAAHAAPLRTFLVEDSATIRDNLIATLQELVGITPTGWTDSGGQASAWLMRPQAPWDLAIVDLFLRQGSGLDVLKACRARAPGRRVVVLTNYATADIRARCLDLGADAVFDKSTDIDALIDYCLRLREGAPP